MPQLVASMASVGGELRRLANSAQYAWTHAREFLHGCATAWVSVASVLVALVVFYVATPAQDLFFEVRGSHSIGFLFWLGFYAAIVLAWVLPVYISARWILCHSLRADLVPAHARSVEDWVVRSVPRVLAVMCLLAVLVGQIMALRISPTLADATSELREQELQAHFNTECGSVPDGWGKLVCGLRNLDTVTKMFAIGASKGSGADDTVFILYLLTFTPLVFFTASWLWGFMHARGRHWRAGLYALTAIAVAVWVATLSGYLTQLEQSLQAWLPQAVVAWTLVTALLGGWSLLLFYFNLLPWKWERIPLKVLWWIITFPIVLVIVAMAATLDYGFIMEELEKPFGFGHVALLPLITLLVAYGVWKAFRPRRITESLATAAGTSGEPRRTAGRVQAAFVVVLATTGLLLAIQPLFSPVVVTEYVYRGLMVPILLGVLVPTFTLLSYLSLRLRLPIVAFGVVLLLAVAVNSDVRPIPRSAIRPTLEDSVDRWAAVNGCSGARERCPSPIIVAAAGGASRAAFLTTSVIGELMDETTGMRPFAKQMFAISAVSGGALGAVITYAAMADSQTPEKATNGLGAPPCDKGAHDTEWFRSGPAWGIPPPGVAEKIPVKLDKKWRQCLQRIAAGDFLSPVFVSLISNDLLGLSLLGDRAAILEDAWERRYASQTGQLDDYSAGTSTLQDSIVDLRQRVLAKPDNWLPVLLLNGTSVTTGRRIITSDIDTLLARPPSREAVPQQSEGFAVSQLGHRLFRDAYDLHELFEIQPGTRASTPRRFSFGLFSPDPRMLLMIVDDTVQIWETESGELRPPISNTATTRLKSIVTGKVKEDTFIERAQVSPDGQFLLITDKAGTVSVWHLATRRVLWWAQPDAFATEFSQTTAQLSPEGRLVLTKRGNQTVVLSDTLSGGKIREFTAPEGSAIEGAAFTPEGVRVITVQKAGLRQIWNFETSSKLADLSGGSPDSGGAVFSPNGKQVLTLPLFKVSTQWAGKAVLWDTTTGAQIKTIQHEVPAPYVDYGFSPDGRTIFTSTADSLVLSFADGTSTTFDTTFGSQSGLHGATFSNDSKRMLVVDGITAELWDMEKIEKVRTFEPGDGWVSGATFSNDRQRVLTWYDNGVAIVWDAETGAELQIIRASRSSMALCEKCDIRLSTAATMSARFPIISPHGNIRNGEKQLVDLVVDGGYYENFGATTALELAAELTHYGLTPRIILINNEPTASGLGCVSATNRLDYPRVSQTMTLPIIEAPVYAVARTRISRGSRATADLCSSIGNRNYALVTVAPPDSSNPQKELSMSWWLSKYVQSYLDSQVSEASFSEIEIWRH